MVQLASDAKALRCAALPARCGASRSMPICASRSVLAGGLRHNQPLLANLCVLPQVICAPQTHTSGAARKRGTNRCAGRPLRPFPVTRARRGRARGRPPAERPRSSPEVALGLAEAARWTPAGVLQLAEEARETIAFRFLGKSSLAFPARDRSGLAGRLFRGRVSRRRAHQCDFTTPRLHHP